MAVRSDEAAVIAMHATGHRGSGCGRSSHTGKGSRSSGTGCGQRTSRLQRLLLSAHKWGKKTAIRWITNRRLSSCDWKHYMIQWECKASEFSGCITVFPSIGESDENHSSWISDWQCTKHEFMNNPLAAESPCSATAFRKSSLNPAPNIKAIQTG